MTTFVAVFVLVACLLLEGQLSAGGMKGQHPAWCDAVSITTCFAVVVVTDPVVQL